MTQEEKQILIKDLSMRLPYGVIYHRNDGANIELREVDIKSGTLNYTDNIVVRECKPYLRPMSSMTEEEAIKYITLTHYNTDDNGKPYRELTINALDWLNEYHFDYRIVPSTGKSMIESGLALKALKGMYKTE